MLPRRDVGLVDQIVAEPSANAEFEFNQNTQQMHDAWQDLQDQ
ncbi:hypothetical protein MY4038_005626, partial [Beauveria bassiana]